ncbi:MAG: methylated-DNA--[protein]-cysteine S-methyltransferase [Bacillales bacterium]|jgi:O-6-methylguanine DNA methyltransferase|nr:methylated-DNA--[protein]-cysteine S-methyltransferase [Bacillales bacterium]
MKNIIQSKVGKLEIISKDGYLLALNLSNEPLNETDSPFVKEIEKQISEYFKGQRKTFDLLILLEGTDFQKKVWQALLNIPYGTTKTYKEIAIEVGSAKGSRAVGRACHKNKLMIIVPCHRVIGSDKSLTGYAGGLEIKKKLLLLEGNKHLFY